ncbi:DUF1488 family protein [Burkholderia pseudomallei]|uniref:DUF1488 family protein n=1 Tax=Burkholderia pseudomallei TaxID=28450 RepID=UPI0012F4D514|nr:DUF1488 family protein [Burkholderia pseudomallei]
MAFDLTPGKRPAVIDHDVHFWLTVDGTKHHCVVTRVALEDRFPDDAGGQISDPLTAFERGKDRILAAAAAKVGRNPITIVTVEDL